MKTQAQIASAGMRKRLKKFSDCSFAINIIKIGIYMAYMVTIGSSELSKLNGPNQGTGVKFEPKKYKSHTPLSRTPRIEEFVGIFVFVSMPLKTVGSGPISLAAKE